MELCGHGDVEAGSGLPGGALPDGAALALLPDVLLALASRAALGLRHYDVKLLNFLAAPVARPPSRYARPSDGGDAGNPGDASSDDDGVGEPYDRTLFDTLYRFFVLLGVPEADALGPAAMLAFDAARRPTMRALLLSPLFAPLRATGELRADAVFATFARRDDAAPIDV
ncbi:hypothetical protein JL722_15009 [Aureococcus anophagefferens]|nr:hypothetical protein JL722_15009 [Aureococcus anophagefferens]